MYILLCANTIISDASLIPIAEELVACLREGELSDEDRWRLSDALYVAGGTFQRVPSLQYWALHAAIVGGGRPGAAVSAWQLPSQGPSGDPPAPTPP